jgi:hypothetical protein
VSREFAKIDRVREKLSKEREKAAADMTKALEEGRNLAGRIESAVAMASAKLARLDKQEQLLERREQRAFQEGMAEVEAEEANDASHELNLLEGLSPHTLETMDFDFSSFDGTVSAPVGNS